MKNLRWLLVLLLFAVPYEEKALGGGDLACCGALGGAGKWGGRSQFSVCVPSASCNSASNTQVAVTYVDGAQSCPAGSYDCVVRAFSQCCGFDCSYYHDQCSAFSPSPSCCAGYCGPGAAKPGSCSAPVEVRGCCLQNEIRVPSSLRGAPGEWLVSYGYQIK